MTRHPLPSALDLTFEQYSGRACVWCGKPLWKGARSAGRARGRKGAHVFDIEVYACADCASGSPVAGTPPRRHRDEGGPPSVEGWPS